MATIFRPAKRYGGKRPRIFGSTILTSEGSSAGVATVTGVAEAIAIVVGSVAGAATVSGNGAGVIGSAGLSAGLATTAGFGSGYIVMVGLSAGLSSVNGATELRQITSTNVIQKPVDYWLAGEPAPERMQVSRNIMRSIFRE